MRIDVHHAPSSVTIILIFIYYSPSRWQPNTPPGWSAVCPGPDWSKMLADGTEGTSTAQREHRYRGEISLTNWQLSYVSLPERHNCLKQCRCVTPRLIRLNAGQIVHFNSKATLAVTCLTAVDHNVSTPLTRQGKYGCSNAATITTAIYWEKNNITSNILKH